MSKFNLMKPNKSSPYYQLEIDNPLAIFVSKDPKLNLSISFGLTKKDLQKLKKVINNV